MKYLLTYSYVRPLDRLPRHKMVLTDDWMDTLITLHRADETVCLLHVQELNSMEQRRVMAGELKLKETS
jgi:hypothetical protein